MKTFVLDHRTLLHHRAGQLLALSTSSIGGTFDVVAGPRPVQRLRVVGGRLTSFLGRKADAKKDRSEVAIVDVIGPLSQRAETFCGWIDGYDSISERVIGELSKDEVGAVVLRIDSPGGDVAGLEESIKAIAAVRDATEKPIAAYIDELAASAAYWLAAGVSSAGIFAPASAEIGSIGAYTMLVDETERLKSDGYAVQLVRDPPGKDAANPMDPVLDVALSRERERVSAAAGRFYAAIAEARGLDAAAVRGLNAATFGAEQAQANGLIDGVSSLDRAIVNTATKAQERLVAARAKGRAMKGSRRTKAEEMPPAAPEEKSSGRATAAEVSATCTECAASCTECAAACEGGTADEAIASVGAMIAACEAAIAAGHSFLGSDASAPAPDLGDPAAQEDKEEDEELPQASVARLARLERSFAAMQKAATQLEKASAQKAEADERRATMARKQMTSGTRARLEAMTLPEFRAACAVLPDRYDGVLAADLSVPTARGGGAAGLSERELAICKATKCDPEKFAAMKRREARS